MFLEIPESHFSCRLHPEATILKPLSSLLVTAGALVTELLLFVRSQNINLLLEFYSKPNN